MSSEANGNGLSYFTLNREGGEVKFPILAPDDMAELAGELRAWRKSQLAVNLHVAGIAGDDLVERLNKFDSRKIRYSDTTEWANTPEGQVAFILRSLRKEKPDATAADVGRCVRQHEMLVVAAGVANLKLEPVEDKNGRPLDGNANPLNEIGDTKAA